VKENSSIFRHSRTCEVKIRIKYEYSNCSWVNEKLLLRRSFTRAYLGMRLCACVILCAHIWLCACDVHMYVIMGACVVCVIVCACAHAWCCVCDCTCACMHTCITFCKCTYIKMFIFILNNVSHFLNYEAWQPFVGIYCNSVQIKFPYIKMYFSCH
jgi:hypothetical protein